MLSCGGLSLAVSLTVEFGLFVWFDAIEVNYHSSPSIVDILHSVSYIGKTFNKQQRDLTMGGAVSWTFLWVLVEIEPIRDCPLHMAFRALSCCKALLGGQVAEWSSPSPSHMSQSKMI